MSIPARVVEDAARYSAEWIEFRQHFDRVPGVQFAVLHEDRVVVSSAYGHADLDVGRSMTDRDLFRIASHSKIFTATALLQLVELGELQLDDQAGEWLSFLDGSPLAAITVREMLCHGGGIVRDGWDGDYWQLCRPFPDPEELRRVSQDAADVLPRNERFKYSNISFSLLGLVVEAAAHRSFGSYVTERLLGPLGLSDTGPDLDPQRAAEYVTGYSALSYADRRLPIESVTTGAMASATGFYSTASDLVRWSAAHFHGDDRLLTDDLKRVMQRVEWAVEGSSNTSYGLGLSIADVNGRRVFGHGGAFPGQSTHTLFDPVDRVAVSVLTNAIDGPAQAMATTVFGLIDLATQSAETGPPSRDQSPMRLDLASFTGRFANLWGIFDIVELDRALYRIDPTVADPTADPQRLEVLDDRTLRIATAPGYASPGERLVFERDNDGSIRSVRGGSGTTSRPLHEVRAAAASRDRIRLGEPLVSSAGLSPQWSHDYPYPPSAQSGSPLRT